MDTIQVKPGDILLLRNRGVRERGSLLAQAIARRGRERFTRIAVVVNDELVADAMPHQGVQLRRWRDIQDRFDLGASRVARNDRLATEPDAAGLVFQRASHFYRQRYDVKAMLLTDGEGGTGDQLCSQFIGALYGDLGLRCGQASGPAAWSHDIDAHTRHGLWRQYPLAQMTPEHHPALPPMTRWSGLPDAVPGILLDNLKQRRATSECGRLLHELQHHIDSARRTLPQLAVPQPWQATAPGLVLGGDAMLDSWQKLFLDGGAMPSGRERLERRFSTHAAQVLASAHQLRDALHAYRELQQRVRQQARHGKAGAAMQRDTHAMAEQLLEWGDAICEDDLQDEVLLRIQNYPLLHEELMELDEAQDDDAVALGANCLVALSEIDLVRLDWTGGQRCALLKSLVARDN